MHTIMISMTQDVAPKVSGGLAAIEEEIRDEDYTLRVMPLSIEVAVIDGVSIPCDTHGRWYVGEMPVAEVRGKITEQIVDCVVSTEDGQIFAGSIDKWWSMMFDYLRVRVQQAHD